MQLTRRGSSNLETMSPANTFFISERNQQQRRHSSRRKKYVWSGLIAVIALCTVYYLYQSSASRPQSTAFSQKSNRKVLKGGGLETDTLVIYIFSNTDPEYIKNLQFFAEFGIEEGDGCDYVIVVQEDDQATLPLPTLPSIAKYVRHRNECYDWGTIGWVLQNGYADPSKYQYFIFMNSSVRGPFIPPYATNNTRWQDLLINKLSDRVKLVGPTISCEGSPYQGNAGGEWRTNPHVQSYVLATDKVGLKVWEQDQNVFKCWSSMWDVIWHGELGSSLAMLKAGYNLDSFMLRYQGVDWLDPSKWGCNKQHNPYGEYFYDGIALNPYEVLFVKMKEKALQNEWSFSLQAAKYTQWMQEQRAGQTPILSNEYKEDMARFRSVRKAYFTMRGPTCFDDEYYLQQNPDLKVHRTAEERWSHFIRAGAFEGRGFRFTCGFDI